MDKAKKIVEKKSSGDVDFDNAIQKFFPERKISVMQTEEQFRERLKLAKRGKKIEIYRVTGNNCFQLIIPSSPQRLSGNQLQVVEESK